MALVLLTFADSAIARPGGGQSFSHGSSISSSSSGGGGIADFIIGLLIDVIWELLPWQVKVGLLVALLLWALIAKLTSSQHSDWTTAATEVEPAKPGSADPPARATPQEGRVEQGEGVVESSRGPVAARLALLSFRAVDPAFSIVILEDFLYTLYAEVRLAQADGRIDALAPYLSPGVLAALKAESAPSTSAVLVAAMRFVGFRRTKATVVVDLEFEVNLNGSQGTLYRVEAWSLTRRADAPSRQPQRARTIDCPGCGAPLDAVIAGTCSHCKQLVATADLDWRVTRVVIDKEERFAPALTGDVEEEGTDLPTVVAPDLARAHEALAQRDPAFARSAFEERVGLVFREFQAAWSAQELARMRPFLSDNLFQTQAYWIDAYKRQHLRNVTDKARIEGIELSRIESDVWYDAITVRVRATSLDYTLAEGDRVVAGSRTKERAYTEYWTFIRSAGRTGPTRTELSCPSCGAPLDINMAGVCSYCKAKVTTGEFDWVLSRIEQDEAYAG